MREDKFDDKIRERLNEVQEDYDKSSWDALSQRLDQEDLPDSSDGAFIPVVKEKLKNHRVEVPEDHWTSLKSDLEYIEERRERLYIIKALEAAIILLLVYTYFNYQWHTSDVDMDLAYIEQVHKENSDLQMIDAAISLEAEVVTTSLTGTDSRIQIGYPAPIITRSTAKNKVNSSISGVTDEAQIFLPEISNDPPSNGIASLEKIGIKLFDNERSVPVIRYPVGLIDQKEVDLPTDGWSIGMPFSYDANFINTEINLGYLSNQIETGHGGTSFGISVAYRKGKYEVESGLRYSEKTFVPGLLTNYTKSGVNSFLESQLDHMVIKQIQIPLLGRIYAAPYKKATLYGIAGVSLNTIIDNEYAIRRTNQSKARLANAPTTDVIDLKNLPRGLAHGGSASENIYMTGVIGFGLRSYMVNGVSWYIQPQYHHSFNSRINELVDKINTLSLEAGIKFSF